MGNKNKNWHKAWASLPNGRRRHVSGLEFEFDDVLGWMTCDDTLSAFQAYTLARGVPLHDFEAHIRRLCKEAAMWRDTGAAQ